LNKKIRNIQKELLSDNWYILHKYTFEYQNQQGDWVLQSREAYDRGDGATILLYNKRKQTIILTRQFRLPTFINGNGDGMMIETCAGLLENDLPEDCVIKEAMEETGHRIRHPQKVLEAYMSPGAVTELIHFFVAEYSEEDKVSEGGGLDQEQENIEVLELSLDQACDMISSGQIKDGKTIMLLQYARLHQLLG